TPIYMAPEALAGFPEPRSDLHALGATLLHAASGRPPALGAAEPAARAAAWLPPALCDLLDRLRAPEPDARPSSALVLLERLARVREALHLPAREAGRAAAGAARALPPVLLPPRLTGRDDQVAALGDALARLARGEAAPRVVRLSGPPRAGRSAILDEAIRRHQLAAARGDVPPLLVRRGDAGGARARPAGGARRRAAGRAGRRVGPPGRHRDGAPGAAPPRPGQRAGAPGRLVRRGRAAGSRRRRSRARAGGAAARPGGHRGDRPVDAGARGGPVVGAAARARLRGSARPRRRGGARRRAARRRAP